MTLRYHQPFFGEPLLQQRLVGLRQLAGTGGYTLRSPAHTSTFAGPDRQMPKIKLRAPLRKRLARESGT